MKNVMKNFYLLIMAISYLFILISAYYSSKSIIVTLGIGIIVILGGAIVYKMFSKLK